MSLSVNNDLLVKEVPQTEAEQAKQISYKGNYNNTFERNPESDSFEKKSNAGKTVGLIAGVIAAAALVVGGICYHKGKPAEGVEKSFKDIMKDGWNKLLKKGEAAAEDAGMNATENAIKDVTPEPITEILCQGEKCKVENGKITELTFNEERFIVKDGKIAECYNKDGGRYEFESATDDFKTKVNARLSEANAELEKQTKANAEKAVVKNAAEAETAENATEAPKTDEVKQEEPKNDSDK